DRFFFFQAEDGIRDLIVTGVQTCALPISPPEGRTERRPTRRATWASAREDGSRRGRAREGADREASLADRSSCRSERRRARSRQIGRASCRERWGCWWVACEGEKERGEAR